MITWIIMLNILSQEFLLGFYYNCYTMNTVVCWREARFLI